ncbi:hypothetical protein, conserved, partial [Eimeria necatrix]
MSSLSPGGHGDCRNDGLAPGQPPNSTVDAAAPAGLHQLRTARPPERPSGIFKAPQEGTSRLKQQQHLQATDSSRRDMEQRDKPCHIGGLGAVASPVCAKDFPKHMQTVSVRAVAAVGHASELDRRQDAIPKPTCAAAAASPTGQTTPSLSRGPYHTFFATEPSKPAKLFFAGHHRGLAGHSNVHSESLNHKTGQSGIEEGREVPIPSLCEGPGAGATAASHASNDFKNNRGHKGQRRLLKGSLDTNRRVRSWWPRDSKVALEDGRNSQCLNAAAGLATASLCHSSSNTGKAQAQHSGCFTMPDTARGGPVGGCSKRGIRGTAHRGSCKVSFAPAAAKTTVQARRACSTCIKAIQGCSTAAAAPVVGETAAGGSTCTGGEDDEVAQDRLHSRGSEVTSTVLYSAGALDGPKAPLPASHSQPAGTAAVPLLSREGSRADAGQPLNAMDDRVPMPHAAKNVSAAATRAAAVAKAAAAVAAAAQAEVVAAATVAAWGESRSCVPTCTSLSSEQRREQLALILRLLLLLPPELQHDIQARLFMLKQQQQRHRWSSAASHPWPKRAATTASLPMTAAASGILGGPWWSHQHQQPHFAASTSTPSSTVPLPFDARETRSRSSSRSSSSTPSGVALKLQQQCMQQQQQQQGDRQPPPQQQQQLLRNSPGDSTVNGLFMSATLQASAVMQLTPERHAGESLAAAADAAGAAATTTGGSAAQVPSSAKLSSCRCHNGSARGPYNRPASSFLVHGRNSLQQQHQQNSQHVTEGGTAGCSNCVGSVHSSCCRLRCSPSNQAGEALLAAALPQRPVGPSCSGCRRCEGTTANVSSSTACCIGTSSCCSRSQGQALNSAQQQQPVAVRGSRSHRGTASLLCYYSASGQLNTSTTAIPQPSSQCCRIGRESFHIKQPPLASQQQQQQQQDLTAEDDTTDTSVAAAAVAAVPPTSRHRGLVDGGVEGCMRSGRGTCLSGAHQQQPGRCGGQQQKSCNAAATQPHVMGLHMAPSRGGCRSANSCSSGYSGSCGWIDQGLLQVQMSSVPSFLRSGAVPRPSNKAADLATLRSSWARLLLAARGGKNTPRTLALSPQTESSVLGSSSSNSSSRNTASSNTVTSNSLSDTSRDASQDTRLFQTEDERLCAEAETCSPETDAADEEQQQQQDAAAAAKAVTVGVSP